MADFDELARTAAERHASGALRLPEDDADGRQRLLTQLGNSAWAAGLSLLMLGRRKEGAAWLVRAADRYRESWPDAPPGSWGRPIASMKARLLAGDDEGARRDAEWALEAGAREAESPIGRYAAVLALLVGGDDEAAEELVDALRGREDFPQPVADALAALARLDSEGYATATAALLADFETRTDFLEDVPVADTVLVLQILGERRGLHVGLASELLPS